MGSDSRRASAAKAAGIERLGRAAPAHLRALVPERRVREGLHRLVQRLQLVRDAQQRLGRIDPPVEDVDLVDEAVEALEDCVELTVIERLVLHRT